MTSVAWLRRWRPTSATLRALVRDPGLIARSSPSRSESAPTPYRQRRPCRPRQAAALRGPRRDFKRPDRDPGAADQIRACRSGAGVLDWRSAHTGFTGIAALRPWECTLTGGEPERVGGARVSANFFTVLGVAPARGRSFSSDDEQPGKENVVVISDALWRRRYGADPELVGRSITINGASHVVAGIAPASLIVPTGTILHPLLPFGARVDVWKPIAPTPQELENESWDHGVLVRLPRGASLDVGRQQLETGCARSWARAPRPDRAGRRTRADSRDYAGKSGCGCLVWPRRHCCPTASVSLANLRWRRPRAAPTSLRRASHSAPAAPDPQPHLCACRRADAHRRCDGVAIAGHRAAALAAYGPGRAPAVLRPCSRHWSEAPSP